MSVLTNHIKAQAHSLGFDVVGVAPVSSSAYDSDRSESERENSFSRSLWEALSKWLAAGFHGSMAWLARDPYRRSHPQSVLPGCRSVIMVGMNYWSKDELVDKSEFGR
ncbi:MAG: hypothetical protein R3B74_13340, partial [Nitrospirales bacterium]|nr:hypothetical protein [Nitrospirales bacterium]